MAHSTMKKEGSTVASGTKTKWRVEGHSIILITNWHIKGSGVKTSFMGMEYFTTRHLSISQTPSIGKTLIK